MIPNNFQGILKFQLFLFFLQRIYRLQSSKGFFLSIHFLNLKFKFISKIAMRKFCLYELKDSLLKIAIS